MQDKHMVRISLMGDGAVGKTSLRKRFMGKGFTTTHMMTIGADFAVHKKEIENKQVLFQIWDLAGQDSFKSVRSKFFRGAMGGLCIFDVTRKNSFLNVSKWIEELWRSSGRGVVPVMILANKSDLRTEESVQISDVQAYANALSEQTKHFGYHVFFLETSAKTGENVNEAFDLLGKQILDALEKGTLKT